MNKISFESTKCWCGADSTSDILVAEYDRYLNKLPTVFCKACSTLRFSNYLTDQSLSSFYQSTYQTMYSRIGKNQDKRKALANAQYIIDLIKTVLDKDSRSISLLEVGGGSRDLANQLADEFGHVAVIEPSDEIIDNNDANNLKIFKCNLEQAQTVITRKYDLIILVHVFEHLSDPILALNTLKKFISDQGKILILVPDFWRVLKANQSNSATRLLGYIHIAHKWNFSDFSMAQMALKCKLGFTRLCVKARGEIIESIYLLDNDERVNTPIMHGWIKPVSFKEMMLAEKTLKSQINLLRFQKCISQLKVILKGIISRAIP